MAKNPHKFPRLVLRLAVGLSKAVLIAAALAGIATLVLLVVWWRVVSWPYRNLEPGRRSTARREALIALATAIGTILATRRRRSPHDNSHELAAG